MGYNLVTFSSGYAGKRQVLDAMSELARRAAPTFPIRSLAVLILRDAPRSLTSSYPGQARALLEWVSGELLFVSDVRGLETLQAPDVTLELGAGDCDDLTILLMALARAVGMRARPVGSGTAGRLTHVHPELRVPGSLEWIAADPTLPQVSLGARVRHDTRMIGREV